MSLKLKNKEWPGFFISFEGGEGSGKTTAIAKLEKACKSEGIEVVVTREPGGTALGNRVRQWVLDKDSKLADRTELLLFLASRVQHLEELILPALQAGKLVLCDRFNDSSVAYQGYARGLGMDTVLRLSDLALDGISPDHSFFFDLDPLVGMERVRKGRKEETDRIESEAIAFHEKVREGYQQILAREPHRITLIDASQDPDTVFDEVYSSMQSYLRQKHV
jgi:dTMP kinase